MATQHRRICVADPVESCDASPCLGEHVSKNGRCTFRKLQLPRFCVFRKSSKTQENLLQPSTPTLAFLAINNGILRKMRIRFWFMKAFAFVVVHRRLALLHILLVIVIFKTKLLTLLAGLKTIKIVIGDSCSWLKLVENLYTQLAFFISWGNGTVNARSQSQQTTQL